MLGLHRAASFKQEIPIPLECHLSVSTRSGHKNGAKNKKNNKSEAAKAEPKSVYESANWWQRTSLWFVLPFVLLSRKGKLRERNLGPVPSMHEAAQLGARLEANYDAEVARHGERASFFRAVYLTFRGEMLLTWIYNVLNRLVFSPTQVVGLGWLIVDFRKYERLARAKVQLIEVHPTNGSFAEMVQQIELKQAQIYSDIVKDALTIMIALCLSISMSNSYFNRASKFGMRARIAACNMIYRKSLRLSQYALGQGSTSTGQMVNLLSNDVNRFDELGDFFVFLWDGPIQALVISYMLSHYYLGFYATASGLIVIIMFLAMQSLSGKLYSKLRLRTATKTDERTRLMNEIIQAIRVIKMYAWEQEFAKQVELVREKELEVIEQSFVVKAISRGMIFVSSKIIVFVMLMVYTALDVGPLTAELVFVSIGLTNLVRTTVAEFFGLAVAITAESLVSCSRINRFLQLPEIGRDTDENSNDDKNENDNNKNVLVNRRQSLRKKLSKCSQMSLLYVNVDEAIVFEQYSARWIELSDEFGTGVKGSIPKEEKGKLVLRNLNLTIKCNELVLVVGRVGSGKSSALMAILGELPRASGRLQVNGLVSYASQEPWLFSATIEANILFGKPMQRPRYKEVLRVCCLERDLSILPLGDQTLVGERGVSLSGGQKARVNLARALYREAEIYLLDDPLSAVDAPVARHIFGECLRRPNGFLAQKTCILATHQLQFLHEADKILLLDNERPAIYGTAQEVLQSEGFKAIGYARDSLAEVQADNEDEKRREADKAALLKIRNKATRLSIARSLKLGSEVGTCDEEDDEDDEDDDDDPMRLDSNSVKQAAVTRRTYMFYLRNAFTIWTTIGIVVAVLLSQSFFQYIDYFLSLWTDSIEVRRANGGVQDESMVGTIFDSNDTYGLVRFYAIMVFVCTCAALFGSLIILVISIRASRNMHKKAMGSLINTKLRFFERTPIGILLNRLSRDFGYIDQKFPTDCMYLLHAVGNSISIVLLTCILNPHNSLMVLFLFSAGVLLRCLCGSTIARLKQLESIARSPLFSHLSTTLNGLTTIRSHRAEKEFEHIFAEHQNHHTSGFFNYVMCYRWVGIVMYYFCITFVCVVTTFAVVYLLDDESTSASMVGLLVSQALLLPGPFQQVTKQLIETEGEITAIERIRQLGEDLELEEQRPSKKHSIKNDSSRRASRLDRNSMRGSIEFKKVTLCYELDGEPVLNELSLQIGSGEKIGIVGRTGAGKSSIISVLFRLYDFDGRIEIDGVDTKQMALSDLRRCMSIIPQEPVLFGGTLRKNLDPFNEHTDTDLWEALEAVQLKALFANQSKGLESHIQEGGTNFSVGQRQLVCLARAILRRNKLLVLDEATANVDPETDSFIQRTIAHQFAHCTVLTIAHRLITIVDSDRVLVMDKGQVAEFAPPSELLSNEEGLFAKMVESSAQQAPKIKRLINEAQQAREKGQRV